MLFCIFFYFFLFSQLELTQFFYQCINHSFLNMTKPYQVTHPTFHQHGSILSKTNLTVTSPYKVSNAAGNSTWTLQYCRIDFIVPYSHNILWVPPRAAGILVFS